MPRQVSASALQALLAESTERVFLVTLVISGTGISTKYLVNDNLPHTIGGQVYEAFPFDITLPTQDADKPPTARIRISNVSREIVDEVRAVVGIPKVVLAVRMDTSLATPEYGPWELDVASANYDISFIELTLRMKDFSKEPYPHVRFTPNLFRGLFN